MKAEQTQQIEFTLSEDGRLFYRGNADPAVIYELSCRAAEQAAAYRRSQTRQDPIALFIAAMLTGLASACFVVLVWQILTRPAPQYTPHNQDYAPAYRLP